MFPIDNIVVKDAKLPQVQEFGHLVDHRDFVVVKVQDAKLCQYLDSSREKYQMLAT